jgi:hypothetical protein
MIVGVRRPESVTLPDHCQWHWQSRAEPGGQIDRGCRSASTELQMHAMRKKRKNKFKTKSPKKKKNIFCQRCYSSVHGFPLFQQRTGMILGWWKNEKTQKKKFSFFRGSLIVEAKCIYVMFWSVGTTVDTGSHRIL